MSVLRIILFFVLMNILLGGVMMTPTFTAMEIAGWIVTGLLFMFCYMYPSIEAAGFQKHKNSAAITLINFFFGWMYIGWVIAAVMAVWKSSSDVPDSPSSGDVGVTDNHSVKQPKPPQPPEKRYLGH